MAVALFTMDKIKGEVLFSSVPSGVKVHATFTELPKGNHGFHIHKAGDLRGEGCKAACEHFHIGPAKNHGGPPTSKAERHTGDLGNIMGPKCDVTYTLKGITLEDLWGRSVIVHEDEDDLGKGSFEDSLTTGHSGVRIGCAIIGRIAQCSPPLPVNRKTRKMRNKN